MDHRCGGCVGTYGKEKREMQGYGEAFVPHLVEFQENTNPTDSGLIIQIHDSDGELVHTYEDQSSEFKYRIIIKDAPKKTTVWTVIGVDEDNWWNEYAPGMDCMREFAPGPYYDPSAQVNVSLYWETSRRCDVLVPLRCDDISAANLKFGDLHRCGCAWGELMAEPSSCGELRKGRVSDRLPLGGGRPKNCAQSSSRGDPSDRGSTT